MAAACRPLALLALCCLAAAAAAAPAEPNAEEGAALSQPAELGPDPALLPPAGDLLAEQHRQLMADTDVFGLYGDPPPAGGTFPLPAAAVSVVHGDTAGILAHATKAAAQDASASIPGPYMAAADVLAIGEVNGVAEDGVVSRFYPGFSGGLPNDDAKADLEGGEAQELYQTAPAISTTQHDKTLVEAVGAKESYQTVSGASKREGGKAPAGHGGDLGSVAYGPGIAPPASGAGFPEDPYTVVCLQKDVAAHLISGAAAAKDAARRSDSVTADQAGGEADAKTYAVPLYETVLPAAGRGPPAAGQAAPAEAPEAVPGAAPGSPPLPPAPQDGAPVVLPDPPPPVDEGAEDQPPAEPLLFPGLFGDESLTRYHYDALVQQAHDRLRWLLSNPVPAPFLGGESAAPHPATFGPYGGLRWYPTAAEDDQTAGIFGPAGFGPPPNLPPLPTAGSAGQPSVPAGFGPPPNLPPLPAAGADGQPSVPAGFGPPPNLPPLPAAGADDRPSVPARFGPPPNLPPLPAAGADGRLSVPAMFGPPPNLPPLPAAGADGRPSVPARFGPPPNLPPLSAAGVDGRPSVPARFGPPPNLPPLPAAGVDGRPSLPTGFGPHLDQPVFPAAVPDGRAFAADNAPAGFEPSPNRPVFPAAGPGGVPLAADGRPVGFGPPIGRPRFTAERPVAGYGPRRWPYGGRSPATTGRVPWVGRRRPPPSWPWARVEGSSRGRPAPVPSGGVFPLYAGWRPGVRWPAPPPTGHFPLYSHWYRPTVVALPGGAMPLPDRTQWPRPAVAVATSEQTSAPGEPDSPPLDADWPWPAVAMANGGDSLVVTGFGRSSGAMATAAGRNNWPPVASATAGGSADRGSFSRASSGGLNLFFQDDKFWSEPAFLRMPPGAGGAAAEPPSGRTSPPPPPPQPLPMVPPPLPTSERPPAGDGGAPSEGSGSATEDQSTTGPSPAQDGA